MKKIIYILVLVTFCLVWGCEKEIPSSFSLDDLPDTPQSPTDIKIVVSEDKLALSWAYENSSEVKKYLIYRAHNVADSLEIYDSTTATEYIDRRVQPNVRYFYEISVVSNHDIEGRRTPTVSAVPGIYSFLINNDNEYTASRPVTLNSSAPSGTSYILLSHSSDFAGAFWREYSNTIGWDLSVGDGVKWIYAKFRDGEGHVTDSVYSDSIILDTKAEIDSVYITPSQTDFEADDMLHFVIMTSEAGGEAEVNITEIGSLKLFDNGSNGDAVALDGIYELDYTIPPLTEVNDATVTASFTDRAGNRAPQKKLPFIITIANPPQTPELTAIGSGEDQIELSWFIPYLNDFDQYRLYRSETSAVDENSHLVTSITVQNNTTYTDTDLEPGTTYYYRVYIYDRSGLSSASNTVSRKTEDNEVPEAVTVAIEEVDSTNFRLSWTRNDDEDFASYRIYRDTESGVTDEPSKLLAIENSQSSTTYSDQGITVGQTYYYRVYVFDRHGASIGSNEVYAPK